MIAASGLVVLVTLSGFLQDEEHPHKGLPYLENLDRAMDYLESHSGVGSNVVESMFAGLAFMLDGREKFKDDYESAIRQALAAYKTNGSEANSSNWLCAYSGFFLAIVYYREKRPELKEKLEDFIAFVQTTREETGGWGHHKGMAQKTGYVGAGGGIDLGMVTATMLSAFLIAKEAGIEVPQELIDRTIQNLTSISMGGGIGYGTGNRSGDRAMSRACQAYIGCHLAGVSKPPFVGGARSGISGAVRNTEAGHAWAPVHFFALTVAAHLTGNPAYTGYWLPKLAKEQTPEGTVKVLNDGKTDGDKQWSPDRTGSTAVFALMILLQRYQLFPKPEGKSKGKEKKKRRGFGKKK